MASIDNMTYYSQIATDFSNTGYSIWKGVKEFLSLINSKSIVGDIGCGNGKNMKFDNDNIEFIGIDPCPEFVDICNSQNLNTSLGNILNIPFKNNYLDHCICIAVIHHLEDRNDRVKAINELLRVTKKGGLILIYVWSINQYVKEKRTFEKSDNIIPFIKKDGTSVNRFYHVYTSEELIADVKESNYDVHFIKSWNEYNNECIIISKN